MRRFLLTNRGLTMSAMVPLVLMTVLIALIAGASPASAQGSAPDTPNQPTGTAVFIGGVDLEWNDVPGADSYDVQLFRNGQWIDLPGDGVEIAFYGAGAIISELNPSSTHWFQVRARNAHGSSDWSNFRQVGSTNQSALGKRARPDNITASGAPVINDTAQVGESLTADATGIEDGNGLDRVRFGFQWAANDGSADTDIAGATDSTYTLVTADAGKTIRVKVNFTDRGGYAESLTSAATEAVGLAVQQQGANNPATGAPTISGTAQVGETLAADTAGIDDADGLTNVSYSYQWVRNDGSSDTDITGATDSTYTLEAVDEGKTVKVRVSFTDDAANAESLTSAATVAVAERPNNPATGTPAITGHAQVGETVTADTSGIADADGLSNVTFSYQWISNDGTSDTDIAGATGSTYTLAAADEGKTIKVGVSFTDDAGFDETLTSPATLAVEAKVNSVPVSHITVEVTEDTSDPNNIVTNFTVTWSDADDCSTDYNAYLNIIPVSVPHYPQLETPASQHHLGSAASNGTQITKELTGVQGGLKGFNVELYCGTDGSGRLVSKVNIARAPGPEAETYTQRPKPATYSSEPPLSLLNVSHGTLTPTFDRYTSRYTVPDVANHITRITVTATPKTGYVVDFFETSPRYVDPPEGPPIRVPVTGVAIYNITTAGTPSGLSADCDWGSGDHLGPLPELVDADPNSPGFQMDLYDGENHVYFRVYPAAYCEAGTGYTLAITRAEGNVSLIRPNRPAVGVPYVRPSYHRGPYVGATMNADVSRISDRDGWDESTFSYQWLADDAEITGATGSSYTVTTAELGKTLKVRVTFTDDRGTEESVTSPAMKVVKLPNVEPTGKPVILGTLEVGQTLTADVSGISDANGMTNATLSYWWSNFSGPVRDGEEYTLVEGDAGRSGMWLRVTYTDDAGHEEYVDSDKIGLVAARSDSRATGAAAITGTAQVGETLTADTSGIADADGLTNVSYSYQWITNDGTSDTDITGATDSTYALVAADQGKTIKVKVSFTDDAGFHETLTSTETVPVESAPNSPGRGAPAIIGTVQVGETLTVDTTGLAEGMLRATFIYQWISNDGTSDTDIAGATDSIYTLIAADEGNTVKVKVTFTNDQGNQESLTSDATTNVAARANSPATGAPAIIGTAQAGATLTADTSGIADTNGLTNVSYSYQWIANDGTSDTDIADATDSTFSLVAADKGKTIKVRVSFTDDAANAESLTSAATAAVAAPPVSYIAVVVTTDSSDSNNVVSNFTVTWSDADECTTNYNAYLNISAWSRPDTDNGLVVTPASQFHLGSTASDGAEITKGLTGVEGGFPGFSLSLYCGTDGSGRLVSRVDIPHTSFGGPPTSGTYSVAESPLNALSVSHGTMTPTFNGYTSSYSVPDVANAETRITITATLKTGYAVNFFEGGDGHVLALSGFSVGGRPSGLSAVCSRSRSQADTLGPLIELTDADPNSPGFQVDLYDGENYVHFRVYPAAYCAVGTGYTLAITRAEGNVSLIRPNRPAIGVPHIGSSYHRGPWVGETMDADVSHIRDRDGWDESTFISYQWLADDAEITGATGSSYTVTTAELGKTLKVRVTFTDDRGTEESVTSLVTKVVKLPNVEPTGKPVILGTLEVGQTLTADVSGISDANGMTNATLSYLWANFYGPVRDGEEYTLVDRDAGRSGMWLRVTYTDDAGHEERLDGDPIGLVAARSDSRATGAAAITGTAQVGETLTADLSGIADADGLTNVSYSYQWITNDGTTDTDITGATDSTYALVAADQGKTIKVKVSFTDDAGFHETLTSTATAEVAAVAPTKLPGRPRNLTGTANSDGTVTLSWDAPADDSVTGYRILRRKPDEGENNLLVHVNDTGSTATEYTDNDVTPDARHVYRVEAINAFGLSRRSNFVNVTPAQPAEPAQNSPATGTPTISGTAQVRETLTADPSGIADTDGLNNVSYSYQWIRNDGSSDTNITGTTGSTYTLVDADEGKTIKVRVSFTDDADNGETLTSAATATVAAAPNNPATGAPTISGTAREDETLTADTLGIADTDGLTNVAYSYQWIRNDGSSDSDITGATDSTYTLVADDEGKTIKVKVTFTDDEGNDESLTSAATGAIAAAPSPLSVSLENNPSNHNGTDAFTFEIQFSEEVGLSYKTLRDHAFTVDGGTVRKAKRQVTGSNIGWTITVEPDSNAAVEIALPATTDCNATGAVCTEDGRTLSNRLEFTVSGPNG